jgi:hypothetical protein
MVERASRDAAGVREMKAQDLREAATLRRSDRQGKRQSAGEAAFA